LSVSLPVIWVAVLPSASLSIICIVVHQLHRVGLLCHLIVCIVMGRCCLHCCPSPGWRRCRVRHRPSCVLLFVLCIVVRHVRCCPWCAFVISHLHHHPLSTSSSIVCVLSVVCVTLGFLRHPIVCNAASTSSTSSKVRGQPQQTSSCN
jgi:hypothetical protein